VRIEQKDIKEFRGTADTVIQNPPFGAKKENRHADRDFLKKAFETAGVIYTIHMATSEDFIKRTAEENGYEVTYILKSDMPLKATMRWHNKKAVKVPVACFRIARKASPSD
jgi:putative methylase